jgi:hypothetical protein
VEAMRRTAQSESLPIDEVDAQTLYAAIRELHRRGQLGTLVTAYETLGKVLRGMGWQGQLGEDTSSQTGQ